MFQKVIKHKYVKYTCSMETGQQNGRFTLFSSKFPSDIYSVLLEFFPTQLVNLICWMSHWCQGGQLSLIHRIKP